MNTKTSILKKVLYITIPLVLIAVVVIKLKNNKEITQSKVYQYDKEQAINVQADTLQIENVNAEFSYSGTFEPNKETKISAEIQGKINEILVDVGSIVKKGQSLVLLDNSLLKLQLQTIEVQIEGLEADVNRYTILAKADAIQGVQLEKAVLGLKSAKVQRATLLEQIDKTTIKVPFNGIVTAKLSEEGAFAAPGIPLLQITDITNLKFTVNVPEKELSKFKLNQSYSLIVDAYSDISLTGKAIMIGSKANMGSSFPVQFTLNNTSDLKIKSGMFGKVNLKNPTQEMGIIIPASAIVGSANQPQIYLIKNGRSVLQNITISKKIQNKVVVSSGLKEGDVIVTNGFINLFDGANVIVK
ncbi:MAG: efflux RND transporter periplasmic adaptor subunit [Bacteroidia bacterium]|nr:efflux RND transporter periplasmic adaptor subunit [Bacteroidia bacterium]MBP7260310.1 efflux RND transporter periplasmic adaptor subunit [Bacteroidia bacterium]MBP9179664.1 efflux RND transporter periplasmic adaptor subunit [Bacteroidia bacterium]MBP9723942.1 efflux RND transporter periplasmic adaptor subunit [Bacteroidia bacterium]